MISGETAYSGIKYLEANRDGKARGHPRVFLGDVKLIDVKNSLNKSKIPVRFCLLLPTHLSFTSMLTLLVCRGSI